MTVLARDDRPIEYLLELKQHNQWDAFHPKYTLWWTLAFALAMVVCTSWQSDDKDIQLSLIFSLALGLLHLMVVWPLQKIFYDSHVVARLLGRQSFEELHVPLGNPRQVVIAIKRFSLMAIFSECGPRVAGGLLLLCLISPAGLTGQGAVFALLTWLIWAVAVAIGGSCFSYGAQILHSLKYQLIARAILLLAMLGLLLNISYGASLAFGLSLDLCSGTFGTDFNSAKLLSGAMLVTLLALALLNRAAVSLCFNRSLEQAVSSRPASRWVIGWGNNRVLSPIEPRFCSWSSSIVRSAVVGASLKTESFRLRLAGPPALRAGPMSLCSSTAASLQDWPQQLHDCIGALSDSDGGLPC
jgi:hypothetical protein